MMELDRSVINEPPTINDFVDRCFGQFPIFLRKDSLFAHSHKLHVQPGIEINLTLEGKGVFVVDKQMYMQMPGQMLIIPGNLPHQVFIAPSTEYKRMVLLIDDAALQKLSNSLFPIIDFDWFSQQTCRLIHPEPDMYAEFRQLMFSMIEEMRHQHTGWQQMIVAQFMSFVVLLRRYIEAEKNQPAIPQYLDRDPIELCCEYIKKNLHEDLSLQNVAQIFNFSPDYLTRIFKREKGITFYQYVLLQRVFESKKLLETHPEMSLTDIAFTVGFASSSQFSRTFKSMTQLTPSQYRRQTAN